MTSLTTQVERIRRWARLPTGMLSRGQTYDELQAASQAWETLVLDDGTPIALRPLEPHERDGVLACRHRSD